MLFKIFASIYPSKNAMKVNRVRNHALELTTETKIFEIVADNLSEALEKFDESVDIMQTLIQAGSYYYYQIDKNGKIIPVTFEEKMGRCSDENLI